MDPRQPTFRRVSFGGLSGPIPVDVIVLLVTVFATLSIDVLSRGGLAILRLGPAAAASGFLWQLVTYPFVGAGGPSLWFLLELFILFWFAKDVFWRLGRRRFWTTIGWAAGLGALVALATYFAGLALASVPLSAFALMQGQRTLLAVVIAAFATLYADRTILLFFVLPLRAGWFVWIEILFAFIGFLQSRDLPGFLGLCAAVWITVAVLRWGGPGRALRRGWLQLRRRWLELRLARQREKRGFRVVDGGRGRGGGSDGEGSDGGRSEPWIHRRRLPG